MIVGFDFSLDVMMNDSRASLSFSQSDCSFLSFSFDNDDDTDACLLSLPRSLSSQVQENLAFFSPPGSHTTFLIVVVHHILLNNRV